MNSTEVVFPSERDVLIVKTRADYIISRGLEKDLTEAVYWAAHLAFDDSPITCSDRDLLAESTLMIMPGYEGTDSEGRL